MPSTSYNDARKKILELNKEIDDHTLNIIKERRKRLRILLLLLITTICAGASIFVSMVISGYIDLFGEDTPTTISLCEMTANVKGLLRITLVIDDFGDADVTAGFSNVEAQIVNMTDGQVYIEKIIPIYLNDGTVRVLINDPELVMLPGPCNLQVRLKGPQKRSNIVLISEITESYKY